MDLQRWIKAFFRTILMLLICSAFLLVIRQIYTVFDPMIVSIVFISIAVIGLFIMNLEKR